MEKRELRKLLCKKLDSLTEEEIAHGNKKIEENFLSLDFENAESAFVYVSAGREVETREIIQSLLERGVRVAVPRCLGKGEMVATQIESLDELSVGMYGLLEPESSAPEISPEKLSLIVVPGLAFDESGGRLGRGAGYYDRFLEKAESALKVGLCREECLLSKVPTDEHDKRVHIVITEERIIK